MNAFHARGPLMVPGLGAGPFDLVFEGNYADRVVNATHYEVTHRATGSHVDGRGHHRDRRERPQTTAVRATWRRAALAAGGALHRRDAAALLEPRRQVPARRAVAVRAHRQRRPVRAAARPDDRRDARRAAQGSPADRRARPRRVRRHVRMLAGEARWSPEESWSLAGTVKGFDPATLRPGIQRRARLQPQGQVASRSAPTASSTSHSATSPAGCAATRPPAAATSCVAGRGLDLRQAALPRRQHQPGDRRQASAHRARSIWISASTPTISRCSPRARAASCTRAAASAARPTRRDQARRARQRHRSRARRRSTSSAANIDVDWRGQRASHADVAITSLEYDERAITQFNATLDGTTSDHNMQARRAGRQDQRCTCRARAASPTERWNANHRRPVHRRHREHQPAARRAVRAVAEREGVQARSPMCLHGKIARAVRRRRVERRGLEPQRRCAQPADQHAHRRAHAQGRVPGHRQRHREGRADAAARRSSATRASIWSTPPSSTSSRAAAPTSSTSAPASSRSRPSPAR